MPRPLLRDLAALLLEETKAGKVKWSGTAVKNAFRLSLGSKTVQLVRGEEWDPGGGEPISYVDIDVLGEKDEEIDSLRAYVGEDYQLLAALYDEARANALNIDGQLTDLLIQLKQGR